MNTTPKLGLVTVLYNGVELLEGFYESLDRQTYKNFILYVIDNSPDNIALDRAMQLSDEYGIESEFINNNENLGVAKGNNQGIKSALKTGCDYILLLNNDIEFDKDTILLLETYANENNESIIVPKILYYGTNMIWMAGGYISKLKATTPHRGEGEIDNGQYNEIEYINYAPTCFMIIKREVFSRVGYMDESYFVYYDDVDFIYRSNQHGYKVVYFPKVNIKHKVSFCTGGGESAFSIYYGTRNRVYFIRKRLPLFYQIVSFVFFFTTRVWKFFRYSKDNRKEMIKGIKDGLYLHINNSIK